MMLNLFIILLGLLVLGLRACSRILATARPSRDTSEARQGGPSTA